MRGYTEWDMSERWGKVVGLLLLLLLFFVVVIIIILAKTMFVSSQAILLALGSGIISPGRLGVPYAMLGIDPRLVV